ncbi:MAG TPA: Sapep family Mn(2+)-dependent dipeptidase [Clostridia bacterium]|nr:Sapep family Mn(2+)-dependent dipeptidase [Clostridia bacterium]
MIINRENAIKWLTDILKFPSVEGEKKDNAPFGLGIAACLDYSLNLLAELGFYVKNIEGYCGYGEIGTGELFGILCHLDVVPISGSWTYPPFGAEIHDNKVYARGALDDKGPFICALYAVMRLLCEGRMPSKRVRFILGCDEESGWECMERYQKTEEMPAMGISPDGDFPVINCEKGIVYHKLRHKKPSCVIDIGGGERANMVPDYAYAVVKNEPALLEKVKNQNICSYIIYKDSIKIEARGKSAHGSHPEDGENAIIKILQVLSNEKIFADMHYAFSVSSGNNVKLNIEDKESGKLTLNLGTVYLDKDEIIYELDIRHPISYTKEQITTMLNAAAPCRAEQGFYHLPLFVPKDHPLVSTLLKAYNKVMKTDAQPIAIGGGTYARVLPLGVAFGPCFPNSDAGIHCVDEYIDLDEFDKASDIYYEAFKELFF